MFELFVNGVRRGEIVALVGEDDVSVSDGPRWLSASDFAGLGIDPGPLPHGRLGDADYVRLSPSKTVAIALDTDALRLSLTFAPELLGRQVIDLSSGADVPPGPALPAHAWVDYDLGLRADRSRRVLSVDAAFNVAAAGWSLRSEHAIVADGDTVSRFRWRTFAERDWPHAMVRLSLGDLTPSRLPFGRSGTLGGVRVARRFDLRPGFSAPPSFAWTGTVDAPTTANIYLDGALLRTVSIAPGAYDLRELSYFSGLHDVRIELSDAFGGRRDLVLPHYFSEAPLRRGLHEFEYSLGVPQGGGSGARAASDPVFTGWHRYGFTDAATGGIGIEATRGYRAWSAEASLVLGHAGTLRGLFARSAAQARGEAPVAGSAMSLDYAFTAGGLDLSLGTWRRSPDFGRWPGASSPIAALAPTRGAQFSASMGLPRRQALSLSLGRESGERGPATDRLGLRYSARLFDRVAFGARFLRSRTAGRDSNEAEIRFQMDFGHGWSGGVDAGRASGRDRLALGVERGIPADGGWGLRGTLEREGDAQRLEGAARRDFAVGELSAQVRQSRSAAGTGAAVGVQFGGALSLVGGALRATRPIREGFALVEAPGLADVRVYRNNTFAGRTDAQGRLLLTGLGPYVRQQVRLDDRDIPLEVQLDAMSIDAVARARIGVGARFRVVRIVSAGGRLRLAAPDGAPLASAVLQTVVDGREVRTSTGPDGDFYLDGLAPGEFELQVRNAAHDCRATLRIDAAAPAFTDLGEVACVPRP